MGPTLRRHKPPPLPPSPSPALPMPPLLTSIAEAAGEDCTADLPEELLALIFSLLGSGDRKRCSHIRCQIRRRRGCKRFPGKLNQTP
uniref:F-box domain-containing protein n=1 Tax=Setaria viridis TaxID=4556 RepID=A0A4V6D3R6_SETVI|nr:hypothetical protein SEVIR_7G057318v2 [Setaria viridis]